MRLAALVHYDNLGSFFGLEGVGFEVPARIWSSGSRFGKQVLKDSGGPKRHILAEVGSNRVIETGWIAFVQRHDLDDTWFVFGFVLPNCVVRGCEHEAGGEQAELCSHHSHQSSPLLFNEVCSGTLMPWDQGSCSFVLERGEQRRFSLQCHTGESPEAPCIPKVFSIANTL